MFITTMSSKQKKPPWKKIYAALPFVCKYCRGLFPDFKFYRRHIRSHESRYKKYWYSREWRAARQFSTSCVEGDDVGYAQGWEDGTQGITVSKIIKFTRRHSYGSQADYHTDRRASRGVVSKPQSNSYANSITLEQAALIAHYQRMQLSKHKAPERYSDSEDHSDSSYSNHDAAMHDLNLLLSRQIEQCTCSDCYTLQQQTVEEPIVPSCDTQWQQKTDNSRKSVPNGSEAKQTETPDLDAVCYGLPTANIPVMLPCPHCPVSFDRAERLALHVKNHYTGNKNQSPPCVTYHAAEGHSTGRIAERRHDLKPSSNGHVGVTSPVKSVPLRQNQGNSSMTGHANVSNNNNTNRICNNITQTNTNLILKCSDSEKGLLSKTDLSVHQKYHQTNRGSQTDTRKHISEFFEDDQSQKPYSCSYCPKTFTYLSSLKTHEFTHTGDPPFMCNLCEEKFTQCSDLKLHERTHIGNNPFKCSKCGRLFKHRPSLTAHEKAHHSDDGKNICPVCLKTFSVGSNLRDHLRIHTGERPYQCASCGRGFIQKSHLRKHVMIHTGERPFKCTYCNKGFTQRGDVRRHEKIHRKVK